MIASLFSVVIREQMRSRWFSMVQPLREGERDAHVRVIEAVVAHDALRLARSVRHAVDGLQILVAVVDPAAFGLIGDVGRALRGLHRALIRRGMRGEHAVIDPRLAAFVLGALQLELFLASEHLEHLAHRLRVVAGLRHVLQAEAVRFHLVLAAVALHPRLRADVGELRDRARAREMAAPVASTEASTPRVCRRAG